MSAFDFSKLKSAAPNPLGLREIRDALDSVHNEPEIVDASMPDVTMADVSMADVSPEASENESELSQSPQPQQQQQPQQSQLQPQSPKIEEPPTATEEHSLALGEPAHSHMELGQPSQALYINQSHFHFAYLVSTWLQVVFNFAVVSGIAWLVLRLKTDVDLKLGERRLAIERNATYCAHEYLVNECRPGLRRPHLAQSCQEWEACMDRDPSQLGWMSAYAATWAEILNEFLNPLNWRSLAVLAVAAVALNWVLTKIRHSSAH